MPKLWIAMLSIGVLLIGSQGLHAAPQRPPAPNFTLPDVAGQSASLDDYQGRHLLLHFWATWCKPCVKEMPEIEAAYRQLKAQGFTVLAVNAGDGLDKVRAFIESRGFTFPVLLDKKWQVAEDYDVIGLPVSFFIDPEGKIHSTVQGGSLTKESIVERLTDMKAARRALSTMDGKTSAKMR